MDGVAAALVGDPGARVTGDPVLNQLLGGPFHKMSGSGNDFVFFDARATGQPVGSLADVVAGLCARGQGVGADGVVFLDQPAPGGVRIAYYNSDGSRAALCGNATLCTASLAVELGAVAADAAFAIQTDAGTLRARVDAGGPSFELERLRHLTPDLAEVVGEGGGLAREERGGFAVAGVPHIVVRVADVGAVDLAARGPALRRARADRPDGANVNYVSPGPDGSWHMRTFERGVEGETLACGTGAAACATLLRAWGAAGDVVRMRTRSGRVLTVALPRDATSGPVLAGEGRLVYVGSLRNWRNEP